jgi:hypothetical protein
MSTPVLGSMPFGRSPVTIKTTPLTVVKDIYPKEQVSKELVLKTKTPMKSALKSTNSRKRPSQLSQLHQRSQKSQMSSNYLKPIQDNQDEDSSSDQELISDLAKG